MDNRINNMQIDNVKDIDVVMLMPMYNLNEYSYNYLKTSGSLWQCSRDEPAVSNTGNLDNFMIIVQFKYKYKCE